MKRLLAILLTLSLLLTGCSRAPSDIIDNFETSDDLEDTGDTVVLNGDVYNNYEIDVISSLSGYKCEAAGYMPEEVLLKLLAKDSDVDIYFLPLDTVLKIKEKGFYYPIESEIVKDFNNSCFDHLRDVAISDNGDTVGMVLDSYVRALIYPTELEEEIGTDIQSLVTLEDYLNFIQGYEGERVGYITDDECFYYELLHQYEKYFCDFKNNVFDYDTDMYKNIYESTLLKRNENGKLDSFYGLIPLGYGGFSETDIDIEKLFMADATYREIVGKYSEFAASLRAIPLPKINDNCKNSVSATYAVINPSSKNIEGAIKVLETIAENRDRVASYYGSYPIIYKDLSDYSDKYMTDTEVFKDYYNIAANGFTVDNSIHYYLYRYDINDYRNGKITADEAIAEYRRMINIWLNE